MMQELNPREELKKETLVASTDFSGSYISPVDPPESFDGPEPISETYLIEKPEAAASFIETTGSVSFADLLVASK
jgi:hypothetical protein